MCIRDRFKINTNATVKLLIGGRWAWHTGQVQSAYEAATFKQDIRFLGYVSDEEAPLLMGGAMAFTYVSNFEGFGIPLLEAMYCEVPVITSTVSSMPEVIGDAGILVEPDSIPFIVSAMTDLYQKNDLRKELSSKAQLQRQKFNWNLTTKRLEVSIRGILNDNI